jgi:hypothetical protein
MKFNLGCEEIDDVVGKMCSDEAKISQFLLINNPTQDEAFLTVLLDWMIERQNKTLDSFKTILEDPKYCKMMALINKEIDIGADRILVQPA